MPTAFHNMGGQYIDDRHVAKLGMTTYAVTVLQVSRASLHEPWVSPDGPTVVLTGMLMAMAGSFSCLTLSP